MRKLVAWTFLLLAMAVGLAVVMTDPKLKQRIEEKRRAEMQAEREAADRKQQEWRDSWARWLEDAKKKNADRAKQANEPGFNDGFRMGFMGGKVTRSKTKQAVSSHRVEALATKEADRQEVPANEQAGFVRGFKAGWDFGWTSKAPK